MDQTMLYALSRRSRFARRLFYLSLIRNKNQLNPFEFNLYSDEECLKFFRFTRTDIERLRRCFGIPFQFRCKGIVVNGVEAICLLLRRMAYPNRLFDLRNMFGREKYELSRIFNYVLSHVYENFRYLLGDYRNWLTNEKLKEFSEAVHLKGAPLTNCWGFIDGTVRPICRPKYYQRQCYNGHKRVHALKYQSVVAANGLIADLWGPMEGKRHDAFMLTSSALLERLDQRNDERELYCLYGDPAYPLRPSLIAPYRGGNITEEENDFNRRMSMNRIVVEWTFGKILQLFAFVDLKKNQKLFLQPVAKYFKVAALLTNCHTCLYGSQTSSFFDVNPPTLEEYLQY